MAIENAPMHKCCSQHFHMSTAKKKKKIKTKEQTKKANKEKKTWKKVKQNPKGLTNRSEMHTPGP